MIEADIHAPYAGPPSLLVRYPAAGISRNALENPIIVARPMDGPHGGMADEAISVRVNDDITDHVLAWTAIVEIAPNSRNDRFPALQVSIRPVSRVAVLCKNTVKRWPVAHIKRACIFVIGALDMMFGLKPRQSFVTHALTPEPCLILLDRPCSKGRSSRP